MMTTARIIAGLKRFNCNLETKLEASRIASEMRSELNEIDKWIKYQEREGKRGEYHSDVYAYLIEDGGSHWVIARSGEEAFEYYRQSMNMTEDEFRGEFGEWEVTKQDGETPLGIFCDDQTVTVIKTCAEWIFEHMEDERPVPVLLCTSDY